MTIAMVSGGFDPLHVGHLKLFRAARHYGRVMIIVNSDEWLKNKKGYVFMTQEDRMEILRALSAIPWVYPARDDKDGTVCADIAFHKPRFFCNGGDRVTSNIKEQETCQTFGVTEVFHCGGGKLRSSSKLVGAVR